MPLTIGLALGWIFIGIWFWVAIVVLNHNVLWSLLVFGSTIAFAVFLSIMTLSVIHDAFRDYYLELNETEAVLVVRDRLMKRQATQMVLLDDINYAEYYPYLDSACIILHSSYIQMEVPLWPLGSHAQDVVDFLSGRGVKVMNVQFDDKVPV